MSLNGIRYKSWWIFLKSRIWMLSIKIPQQLSKVILDFLGNISYWLRIETLLQVQVQPLLNCVTFGSFLIRKMDVINSISMNKLVVKIKWVNVLNGRLYKQQRNNKDGMVDLLQELMDKERRIEVYIELMIWWEDSEEKTWNEQGIWHLSCSWTGLLMKKSSNKFSSDDLN